MAALDDVWSLFQLLNFDSDKEAKFAKSRPVK